jgi:hypothetical protein
MSEVAREGRVRVVSTRDGYQGRRAGRVFDVSPAEFLARGPKPGDGMLKLAPGQGFTAAAVREAARSGANLADVKDAAPVKKVTVRRMKKKS